MLELRFKYNLLCYQHDCRIRACFAELHLAVAVQPAYHDTSKAHLRGIVSPLVIRYISTLLTIQSLFQATKICCSMPCFRRDTVHPVSFVVSRLRTGDRPPEPFFCLALPRLALPRRVHPSRACATGKGAIFLQDSTMVTHGCIFSENRAATYGGERRAWDSFIFADGHGLLPSSGSSYPQLSSTQVSSS